MELLKIDVFIRHKVEEYERYSALKDSDIPPCSGEERWERAPKFAVMKTGNKRAVKLFDEQGPADQLASEKGEGHYVEFRQGESVKCQSYCLCASYCNYYLEAAIPVKTEMAA
jgi:hypothetical protein